MTTRQCAKPDCIVVIPRTSLACRVHWLQLPPELREEIVSASRRFDSEMYRRAVIRALHLWGREGRTAFQGRTIRKDGKAVAQIACPNDGAWLDLSPDQYRGREVIKHECGFLDLVNFETGLAVEA